MILLSLISSLLKDEIFFEKYSQLSSIVEEHVPIGFWLKLECLKMSTLAR